MELITRFVLCQQVEAVRENLVAFKQTKGADYDWPFAAPVEYRTSADGYLRLALANLDACSTEVWTPLF
jgi:hypothetical protein